MLTKDIKIGTMLAGKNCICPAVEVVAKDKSKITLRFLIDNHDVILTWDSFFASYWHEIEHLNQPETN